MANYSSFADKALTKYGDRFIYHWDTYTRLRDPMTITDTITGKTFEQIPSNHLRSLPHVIKSETDCNTKRTSPEKAINKLKKWHPDLDFTKTVYVRATEKISVICPIHGEFTKRYSDFSESSGCPSCGKQKISNNLKLTQKEFEDKVYAINPDLDLSKAIYIDSNTPVTVISPLKGEFDILPVSLFKGYGKTFKKLSQEEFIKKVNTLHPEYDFSDTVYKGMREDIKFICPEHGEVSTQASSLYYRGSKCNQCSYNSRGVNSRLDTDSVIKRLETLPNRHNITFELINYIKRDSPIILNCPKHGAFEKEVYVAYRNISCPKCVIAGSTSKYELDIIEYIKSIGIPEEDIEHSARPEWLRSKELDIYLPKYNLAIEYNGTAFHHSSNLGFVNKFFLKTSKDKYYHFDKWKICFDNGITLLSIYDFYWDVPIKQFLYKSKIKHHLGLDNKVYARKCTIIKNIDKQIALEFLDNNHIEGSGFQYKDTVYYGLYNEDNKLLMVSSIGSLYNQSSKIFEYKLNRICTLNGYTVVGGITKLTKAMKKDFENFKYQITLSSGGNTLKATKSYKLIEPRYFWINPKTLEYHHRNYCQKKLLQKHFDEKVLDTDTESTYMERLGYLKVFDNGLAEVQL